MGSGPPGARRVLVLFAHPAFHRSRVHRALLRAVRAVDGVTLHDLYESYPDFDVDVRREQELLLAHDVVVLQHPLYWYSMPPLVKQWIDLVLEYGWAYGKGGTVLHGKQMLCALSTGGGAASYRHEGSNRFTLEEFLAPVEQTARLCGLEWLAPFVVHGTHTLDVAGVKQASEAYERRLRALRHGSAADTGGER